MGWSLFVVTFLVGSIGVVIGGVTSDSIVKKYGIRSRVAVLAISQVCEPYPIPPPKKKIVNNSMIKHLWHNDNVKLCKTKFGEHVRLHPIVERFFRLATECIFRKTSNLFCKPFIDVWHKYWIDRLHLRIVYILIF